MDSWLTNEIKELLSRPCLEISGYIGERLENRLQMSQSIDERALTEDLVDRFDSSSKLSAWNNVINRLRYYQIYLDTKVRKSTKEYATGADIGLIVRRSIYGNDFKSSSTYAVLVQCKRIDENGTVSDFFHKVNSSGKHQSKLMLDITPSSFYFIFTPPALLKTYCTVEPLAFANTAPGCSSPIWNMGHFEFDSPTFPFLTAKQKADVTGILVVPALAVEAQEANGKKAKIQDILPNSLPFWYWFGELLIPGFIGDYRKSVISVAMNDIPANQEFGVKYSIEFGFGNG